MKYKYMDFVKILKIIAEAGSKLETVEIYYPRSTGYEPVSIERSQFCSYARREERYVP